MALTFTQIVDKIDRACGTNSTSYTLAQKATDINLAQNEGLLMALKNAGWNVDDFNHTKEPIITTDLVNNQRDYHFTYDEQTNLIIGFHRVMVADSNGVFYDLVKVNQQVKGQAMSMVDGQNITGSPYHYTLTGNGLFLDPIPNYDYTSGIKCFIDREMIAFTSSDTTKISGLDGLTHDYLYLKPAYEYARDKGLKNAQSLYRDLLVSKSNLEERYANRNTDEHAQIIPKFRSSK